MADFCKQCAQVLFPPGFDRDLAGLIPESEVKLGLRAVALCEGCGPTHVDHEGVCQGACMRKDHPKIWP